MSGAVVPRLRARRCVREKKRALGALLSAPDALGPVLADLAGHEAVLRSSVEANTLADTILRFPDRFVGVIHRLDPVTGKLERLCNAEGTVAVPADALLHVVALRGECLAPLLPAALRIDGLEINKTATTDDDLAPVASFVNLRYLNASKARQIGDAGIRHLSGLPFLRGLHRLARLSIEQRPIDDTALAGIDCPGLSKLVAFGTRVTAAGVEAFRLRFPGCEVVGDVAITEKNAHNAAGARLLLTRLVRRLVGRHPLKADDGDAAVVEVLERLFPPGTQLEGLVAGAKVGKAVVIGDGWYRDELWGSDLVVMLRFLARGSQVRISFPGGSRLDVPWLVERGPERRQPPSKVLAN